MNLINLGKLVEPHGFEDYIKQSESLSVHNHRYGTVQKIPDYPCWMEYKDEGGVPGSISFTRNTHKHPALGRMVEEVLGVLAPIFTDRIPLLRERVHLLKTVGSITPHRDEANRLCCINIGIKNSSSAVTKISNDGIRGNFSTNNTEHTIQDGYGYLLNTSELHSVEGSSKIPRYLITYGFGISIEKIRQDLTINE